MDAPRGFTESMLRLWEEFSRMPGIGRRTAERLAFYLLDADKEEVAAMVTFVASPLSAATNGAALRVDGGVVRSII